MTEQLTIVYLSPKQVKHLMMVEFLDSVGVFDIKIGRVTLDFDKDGKIGNVKVEQNYKPPELST